MFSYPRLGTETRPSVDSMCNAADEPCPIYDSRVGYTNGTLHFGDRDGLRKDGTAKTDHGGLGGPRPRAISGGVLTDIAISLSTYRE